MFCIMLTGSALATGSAAPPWNHALGEQPGRAEAIDTHEDGRCSCVSRLASAQLQPSQRLSPAVPRRPSDAMPLRLPGNGVRWTRANVSALRARDEFDILAQLQVRD